MQKPEGASRSAISNALDVEDEQIETIQHSSILSDGALKPVIKVTLRRPAFPWRVQYVGYVENSLQRILVLGA